MVTIASSCDHGAVGARVVVLANSRFAVVTKSRGITPRQIDLTEKEARALNLRTARATYAQIGAQLGVSEEGARKMVLRALAKVPVRDAEEYRKLFNIEYDKLYLALQPAIHQGDLGAVDRALKVMEAQRKMNDVDVHPVKEVDPLVQLNQVNILDPDLQRKLAAPATLPVLPELADGDVADAIVVDEGITL